MPELQRLTDPNSAGAPIIEIPQSTVYANNLLVSINGSQVEGHGIGEHSGPLTTNGAPTVFANNISVNFTTNPDTCGHERTGGSPTVFVGESMAAAPPSFTFTRPSFVPDSQPVVGQKPDPRLETIIKKPETYYKPENAASGAKPNFPGTPDTTGVVDPEPPVNCKGPGLTVLSFLRQCLDEARSGAWRETGQGGKASNSNILKMWKNIGYSYSSDQVPWCAGFACFAMKQSGMKFIKEASAPNLVNRCKEYEGRVISVSEMRPGDLVYWTTGHVSFCYTASGGKYTFVGGNQLPGKGSEPPVRDPQNDGDVTISWPTGWTPSRGGIGKVVRIEC